MRRIENPQRISYRLLHEATNPLSYRFLREATGTLGFKKKEIETTLPEVYKAILNELQSLNEAMGS